jgi:hypothetical protein
MFVCYLTLIELWQFQAPWPWPSPISRRGNILLRHWMAQKFHISNWAKKASPAMDPILLCNSAAGTVGWNLWIKSIESANWGPNMFQMRCFLVIPSKCLVVFLQPSQVEADQLWLRLYGYGGFEISLTPLWHSCVCVHVPGTPWWREGLTWMPSVTRKFGPPRHPTLHGTYLEILAKVNAGVKKT